MAKAVNFQVVSIKMVKEEVVSYEGAKKTIRSPRDVFTLASKYLEDADREHMVVMALDTKNQIIGVNTMSIGSINQAVVHPREVFKFAILSNAASIILCHNHPSGDPTPSSEDIEITARLKEAGGIMGIEVLDHVIVGDQCYSMREKGDAGW